MALFPGKLDDAQALEVVRIAICKLGPFRMSLTTSAQLENVSALGSSVTTVKRARWSKCQKSMCIHVLVLNPFDW